MANALDQEISLIAESQYPVSLKSLYDVVKITSGNSIALWADRNPDHVQPLAEALLEALEIWPYAVDLLRIFVAVKAIRDHVLINSPYLIQSLLDSATASTDGFNKVSSLCVALLSTPLPSNIGLPASGQPFLSQLFERAIQTPSLATVEPVHAVLSGACESLLDLLPPASLNRFREHLTRMLKSVKSVTEQSLNLYCLAILSKVQLHIQKTRNSPSSSSSDTTWSASLSQQEQNEIANFFSGERAQKVVVLVVCQVMHACGNDKSVDDSVSLKLVLLAREIMNAVDPDARRTWTSDSKSRMYIDKLNEKACKTTRGAVIQVEAVDFIASLLKVDDIPSHAIKALEQHLIRACDICISQEAECKALSDVLPTVASQISTQTWSATVEQLFSSIGNCQTIPTSLRKSYISLLRTLRDITADCKTLRRVIMEAMSANALQGQLHQLVGSSTLVHEQSHDIVVSFVSLLLSAGLCAHSDEPSISSGLVMQLLSKQESFSRSAAPAPARLKRSTVSTLSVPHTAREEHDGRHWRDRLYTELDMQSKKSHQSVVELFGQTCRDLEDRCYNVEEPLRRAQAKSDDLQHSLDAAEAQNADLSEQISGLDTRLRQANEKTTQLSSELLAVSEEVALKTEHLVSAQQEIRVLQETRLALEGQLDSASKQNDSLSMEIRAATASHAESLRKARVKHEELEPLLAKKQQELEVHKRSAGETDAELRRVKEHESILQTEVKTTQAQLDDAQRQLQNIVEQHTKQVQDMQAAREAENSANERLLQETQQRASETESQLQERVTHATEECRNLSSQLESLTKDKDQSISNLKRKCRQLTDERNQKTAELAKAQEWRTKLKSVVDLGGGTPHVPKTGPAPTSPTRPRSRRDHKTASLVVADETTTPDDFEIKEVRPEPEASFESQSSSTKSGPSPKRAKPRKAFKVPFSKGATHNVDVSPSKTQRQSFRAPLGELAIDGAQHSNAPERRRSTRQRKSLSEDMSRLPSSRKSVTTLSTWDDNYDGDDAGIEQPQAGQENAKAEDIAEGDFAGLGSQDMDETTLEFV